MNPSVPPTGSAGPRPEDPELMLTLRQTGPGSRVFDRFCLERELGAGGMGVVWLAHDEWLDRRTVALKFLPGIISGDTEALSDLRREIRHGLDINHPGIVRVYDLHENKPERLAAIAMEFVDGKTLSELKAAQPDRCFDPAEILSWLRQLCDVLDYLHKEAGVVHRDLKPRNLMITQRGRLKLADFGIAAAISESHSRLTQESRSSTGGTPCYMSPQQIEGKAPRPSDDIYALGATIFELLAGKPPFFRGPAAAILSQVENEAPPSVADRRQEFGITTRPLIPQEWEEAIAACLSKAAENRPVSACDVFHALAVPFPNLPDTATHFSHEEVATFREKPQDTYGQTLGTADQVTMQAERNPATAADSGSESALTQRDTAPKKSGLLVFAGRLAATLAAALAAAFGIHLWSSRQVPSTAASPPPAVAEHTAEKPGPNHAAELFRRAEINFNQNHYLLAFNQCRAAVEEGDFKAELLLARLYAEGLGTPRNTQKALDIYQRLADRDNSVAQTILGWWHANGINVPKNEMLAVAFYKKASTIGNPTARNNLGLMLLNGEGAPKDERAAAELFEKALAQGEARAANNLGVMCRDGLGMERSDRKAQAYFEKGAAMDDAASQANLGALYFAGRTATKDDEKAVSLLRSAAEKGNPSAAFNLGVAFEDGLHGLPPDPRSAADFYQIAADKGNARALNNLAMMYADGRGVQRNPEKAISLCGKAAEAGDTLAEYNLACLYDGGFGVPRDERTAFDLYTRAADAGVALAQCALGKKYALGLGVAKNESMAAKFYVQAAENGYAPAMRSLASFYESGFAGLRVSKEKAEEWRKRAMHASNTSTEMPLDNSR